MPVGTSVNAFASGFGLTIKPQSLLVNRAYWFTNYPSKVPGSIRLNPAGFMPNGRSVNQMVTCHRLNCDDGYVLISTLSRLPTHSNYEMQSCTRGHKNSGWSVPL